jgi:hypothetical protein
MKKICASSKSELMAILSEIDIRVPLRSEGRTKEHSETWSICYWLSTFPNLAYPFLLTHRDKPDFYIKSGIQEIGIEHTEAIPSDYAHANAVSEKNADDTVLDMSLFQWGQKKTNQEIYDIVGRTKLTGPGWEGDSPEIEWALVMAKIINIKTIKLRKEGFSKFPTNYLLIYDNLPRPSYIDFSRSCPQLITNLNSYWDSGVIFDIIFVQTDDLLMSFDSSSCKTLKNNKIL